MSEQIKKIVSEYTKMSMDQLQSETRIGRSALGNSIILHRMYAAIAKEGFEVQGYQNVKTFGELENKILQAQNRGGSTKNNELKAAVSNNQFNEAPGIGVDIEETSQMPRADDFREDEFYQMNFTPQEIAYCISQPDQYASFTGIFAVKEAIVKAENYYRNIPFNTIFIDHLPGGQPIHEGFQVSISHTPTLAVAVVIKNSDSTKTLPHQDDELSTKNISQNSWLSIISILLALIAICISLFKT